MASPDSCITVYIRKAGSVLACNKVLLRPVPLILQASSHNLFYPAVMYVDTWSEFHFFPFFLSFLPYIFSFIPHTIDKSAMTASVDHGLIGRPQLTSADSGVCRLFLNCLQEPLRKPCSQKKIAAAIFRQFLNGKDESPTKRAGG